MPLDNFLERLDKELLNHSVITDNKYCNWFKQAELSPVDVLYFTQQFSVFSPIPGTPGILSDASPLSAKYSIY